MNRNSIVYFRGSVLYSVHSCDSMRNNVWFSIIVDKISNNYNCKEEKQVKDQSISARIVAKEPNSHRIQMKDVISIAYVYVLIYKHFQSFILTRRANEH